MTRPNILFIMPDQHRADVMGCAGNPVVSTPNLDALASEGVRFTDVVTQSPLCQPARASLITGRYPHQHGAVQNARGFPPPEAPNFMHLLVEAGYHTAAIGKVHIGNHPSRDSQLAADHLRSYGFDHVDEEYGKIACLVTTTEYTRRLAELGLLEGVRRDLLERLSKSWNLLGIKDTKRARLTPREAWSAEPAPVPAELYIDNHIADRAERWLSEYDRRQPFFLWVGFAGPHDPFDAPQVDADPYLAALETIPLPAAGLPASSPSKVYQRMIDFATYFSDAENLTPERVRRLLGFYYGNVTLIDRRIGDLVEVLRSRDLLDNTWIVYTSDHGEMGGAHRLLGKMLMYQQSLRVPLIIRPPEAVTAVREAAVELNDVAATILDIAGAGALRESSAQSLLGHLAEDRPGRDIRFSEVGEIDAASEVGEVTATIEVGQVTAVIAGDCTYVVETRSGVPCALFDRRLDPDEGVDRVSDTGYAEVRERLDTEVIRPFLGAAARQS
jgi:choline-sulfatase